MFDTGEPSLPTVSVAGGVGQIIASSAPTSVVGSMTAGVPQVVVASGAMNNTATMNGVTTNSMGMGPSQVGIISGY